MNSIRSASRRTLQLLCALAFLTAASVFQAAAEDTESTDGAENAPELQQLERIPNKLKPGASALSIDLPFSFDAPFIDEEIPEEIKSWFKASKRSQADMDKITLVCSYVNFSQDYLQSYINGNEDAWMKLYLQGSMINKMKELEQNKQIKSFSYRTMDIKLTGSKDNALLMKGSYRENTKKSSLKFEVWVLQILHKKEVWQLIFFFDPKDETMRDAVEAACFGAVVK